MELEQALGFAVEQVTKVSVALESSDLAETAPDTLRLSFNAIGHGLQSSMFLRGGDSTRKTTYLSTGGAPAHHDGARDPLAGLIEDLALPHPQNVLALPAERAMLAQSIVSARLQTTPIQDFSRFMDDAVTAAEVRIGPGFANACNLAPLLERFVLKGTPQCLPEAQRRLELVPRRGCPGQREATRRAR